MKELCRHLAMGPSASLSAFKPSLEAGALRDHCSVHPDSLYVNKRHTADTTASANRPH